MKDINNYEFQITNYEPELSRDRRSQLKQIQPFLFNFYQECGWGCVKGVLVILITILSNTQLFSYNVFKDSTRISILDTAFLNKNPNVLLDKDSTVAIPKAICPECIAKLLNNRDTTLSAPDDSSDIDMNDFFKKLGIDSSEQKFDIDSKEKYDIKISYGWFPSPLKYWNISIALYGGWLYDIAHNINPRGLRNVYSYSGSESLNSDERTMKKKFSNDDGEDEPVTDVDQYGLEYCNTFSLPLIFRLGAYYIARDGLLFSGTTEKPFLAHDGSLINFKEASMVFMQEKGISLKFGLELPIYGAFQDFNVYNANSYYYFHAGALIDYILSSKATQFIQIADNKDKVRYFDGLDTLNLVTEITLPSLSRTRYYLDLALGMETSTASIGIKLETFWTIPFTSVIKDANWKQNIVGLRTAIDVGFAYKILERYLSK